MGKATITHYYWQEMSPLGNTLTFVHVQMYSNLKGQEIAECTRYLNCTLTVEGRSPPIRDGKYRKGQYFVSSHKLSLLPKIQQHHQHQQTSLTSLRCWNRDEGMGLPRSSPLRNLHSHAEQRAISIPHTWGSCRVLSPPHPTHYSTSDVLGQNHVDDTQAFVCSM